MLKQLLCFKKYLRMFYVNVLYLSIEIRCLRSVQNHLDEQQCWVVDFFIECLKYIFTFQELITKDIIKNKAKGLRMLFVGKAQCSFKKNLFTDVFKGTGGMPAGLNVATMS